MYMYCTCKQEYKTKYTVCKLSTFALHLYFFYLLQALSILQNGKLPAFLEPELLEELWQATPSSRCIQQLQQGLNVLGLFQVRYTLHCIIDLGNRIAY